MKIDIAEIAKQNGKKGTAEIAIKPIPKIEAVQYFKELNKLTKSMRQDIKNELMPLLKALESSYAVDGYADQVSQLVRRLTLKYQTITDLFGKSTAQKMVNSVSMKNEKAFNTLVKRSVGVDLTEIIADEGLNDFLEGQVNKNVTLIRSIPDEYFKSIETVVMNGTANGLRWEAIAREIGGIKDISSVNGKLQNRIKLIARNETSNLNASISKKRMETLNITEARWQTAEDERVRQCHKVRDGKVYNIKKGLFSSCDNKTLWPGSDINCRCVAIPIIKID
jgi:SPP1 gp7 family putative phage head morphogenesis protein